MVNKYRTIDKKLNKLSKVHNPKNEFQKLFYPRVDNRTNIEFSGNEITLLNTFTAIVDLSRFNNSCLKSPTSTLVDLTFQSRTLRSFSLNQPRNLSL